MPGFRSLVTREDLVMEKCGISVKRLKDRMGVEWIKSSSF